MTKMHKTIVASDLNDKGKMSECTKSTVHNTSIDVHDLHKKDTEKPSFSTNKETDENNTNKNGDLKKNDTSKEPEETYNVDIVAEAEKRWEQSTETWLKSPIHFDKKDKGTKFLGCVSRRIGIKHINKNHPLQDSVFIYQDNEKDFMIISVADGHGDESHDLSEFGSDIACKNITSCLKEIICDATELLNMNYFVSIDFKSMIVNKWRDEVLKYHEIHYKEYPINLIEKNKIIRRYGTTLIFALGYKEFYIVGQIGDGTAVILNNNDKFNRKHKAFPEPKIGGKTDSLCEENAEFKFHIKNYLDTDISGIVLMTDGYYDIWRSEKGLMEASKYFLDSLAKSNVETESDFIQKYNKASDGVNDDISIGVLSKRNRNLQNSYDKRITKIYNSCTRTTFSINNAKGLFYNAVYFNSFANKDLTQFSVSNNTKEFNNIVYPVNIGVINGLKYYIYQERNEQVDYYTLDKYIEYGLIYKDYMTVLMSGRILRNIIYILEHNWSTLENLSISLDCLLNVIEFSPKNAGVRILWTAPIEKEHNISKGTFSVVIARYLLNFISIGRLYYDEKSSYSKLDEDSIFYRKQKAYPANLVNTLMVMANGKGNFTINEIAKEVKEIDSKYICCSNCCRISIIEDKNSVCVCKQSFDILGYLVESINKVAVSTLSKNTFISLFTDNGYEYPIKIVHDDNKIGFQNISKSPFTATKKDNTVVSVQPDMIIDISVCSSFTIYGKNYTIQYIKQGDK
ncbi:MAG: protein phosphatase 2C domain-containing protein [Candidatus Cloacimonetes bacterium]|nr:protein phosphatase 2C domain-containing protein [Candidatus Cloacimonadota bacterium]